MCWGGGGRVLLIRKFIIDYNQDVQMNVLIAIVQKPRPVNEQRITQEMGLFVCWKCEPQTHCDLNMYCTCLRNGKYGRIE